MSHRAGMELAARVDNAGWLWDAGTGGARDLDDSAAGDPQYVSTNRTTQNAQLCFYQLANSEPTPLRNANCYI